MTTNTSLYITERNLHMFQQELEDLKRQTRDLLAQAEVNLRHNERGSVVLPDRLLKQERLAGRIAELDWLLKRVRPVFSPHYPQSVIEQR